ncbi:hypothetical protein EDB84DRAFT_1579091 [Lactarius hengduanensis]|nr:hypothetical protein EDB84DRAFT_1579091 [Lactarius hengduanensis]
MPLFGEFTHNILHAFVDADYDAPIVLSRDPHPCPAPAPRLNIIAQIVVREPDASVQPQFLPLLSRQKPPIAPARNHDAPTDKALNTERTLTSAGFVGAQPDSLSDPETPVAAIAGFVWLITTGLGGCAGRICACTRPPSASHVLILGSTSSRIGVACALWLFLFQTPIQLSSFPPGPPLDAPQRAPTHALAVRTRSVPQARVRIPACGHDPERCGPARSRRGTVVLGIAARNQRSVRPRRQYIHSPPPLTPLHVALEPRDDVLK